MQLQQRYIADTILDANRVGGVDVDKNTVSSDNSTSVRLSYTDEMANRGAWNVSLNVNNLFDDNQPIMAGAMNRGGAQ